MRNPSEITTVGFKPPLDQRLILEVLTISELLTRAPAEHFAKVQRADFYRLVGVLDGHTRPMVDFSAYDAKVGDWLLVRPGQVFRYDFSSPWSGIMVVFKPESLSVATRNRSMDDTNVALHVEDLSSLHSLNQEQHNWMTRSLMQMHSDGVLTASAALRNDLLRLQLASTLIRLSLWQSHHSLRPTAAGVFEKFRRFRHQLELDFSTHHQVQHYAKTLGMSEKSLSRVCVAAAGVPAKTCIAQRIILEARRLLAHTRLTVQSIGLELGFDEATNFAKYFRHACDITPLEFRLSQMHASD